MREAREEMLQSLNESNLEKMRKASKGAKQTLKMKDGSIGMDSFTASAIMQIYDKVNDKNKKTMENLLKDGKKADIVKLMKFAMSKVNAEYVPEEFEEEVELDEGPMDGFLRLTFKSPADVKKAMKVSDTEFGYRYFTMDKARTRPELDIEGDRDDLQRLKDALKSAGIKFKIDLEEKVELD